MGEQVNTAYYLCPLIKYYKWCTDTNDIERNPVVVGMITLHCPKLEFNLDTYESNIPIHISSGKKYRSLYNHITFIVYDYD